MKKLSNVNFKLINYVKAESELGKVNSIPQEGAVFSLLLTCVKCFMSLYGQFIMKTMVPYALFLSL